MSAESTQAEQIAAALRNGETITPLDALHRFGCFRLGARIWELKRAPYSLRIETTRVESNGKTFAGYKLDRREPGAAQGQLFGSAS